MPELTALEIRKVPDKSEGERVARFHPVSGSRYLANPDTWRIDDPSTWVATPWPLAGIDFTNDPPQNTHLSQSLAQDGVREDWLELENVQIVHRPGGPPDDLWRVTHTFYHVDFIIFKTVRGDVVYRVTQQPDKYVLADVEVLNEEKGTERRIIDPTEKVTPEHYMSAQTEVTWYYVMQLEGDHRV